MRKKVGKYSNSAQGHNDSNPDVMRGKAGGTFPEAVSVISVSNVCVFVKL